MAKKRLKLSEDKKKIDFDETNYQSSTNKISPDQEGNVNIGLNEVLTIGNSSNQDINIIGDSSDTTITKESVILNDTFYSTNITGREGLSNYNEKEEHVNLSLDKGLDVNKKLFKTPGDDTGDYIYETIETITNNDEIIKKSEIVNENYDEGDGYSNKWSAIYDTYYGNSKIYFTDENTIDGYYTKTTILDTYNGFYNEAKTSTSLKTATLNSEFLSLHELHNDGYSISSSTLDSEAIVFEGMYNRGTSINNFARFGNIQYYTEFGTKPSAYFLEEDKTDLNNKQRITIYNVDGIYSYSSLYGSSIENTITYFHIELPKVPTENTESYKVDFRLKSGTVALLSDLLELTGPTQIADILNFIDKIESQSKSNSDSKVQNIRNVLSTNAGIGTVMDYIDGTYVDKKIEGTTITFEPLGKSSLGLIDNGNGNYDLDLAGVPIVIADSAYPDHKYFVKTKGNTNFTIEMQTLLITETLTGNGYVLNNYNASLPDLEVQMLDYYALVGMIGFNPISKYMYRVTARVKTTHENVDSINNTQFISYVTPINLKEVGFPSGTIIELAVVDAIMGRIGDYNVELVIP